MGQIYVDSLSHVRSIKLGLEIDMSLFEALKIILEDEKTIGEEYVSLLHSKLRLAEEDNIALKRMLKDIAADEEKHLEPLKLILDAISPQAVVTGFHPCPSECCRSSFELGVCASVSWCGRS
jgi:rubrerythrin